MARQLFGILILAVASTTGCDRENSTLPTAAAQRAANDAAVKAAADTQAATDAKIAANLKAASDTKAAADAKIAADLKAATDAKTAADKKTATDIRNAADARAATNSAARAAAEENNAKANSLLIQLRQSINDNQVELAESTLTKLDDMKASLSASLNEEIETARTALNAKKETAALTK